MLLEWERANPRQFQDMLGDKYNDFMSLKENLNVNEDGSVTTSTVPGALSETNQKVNSQRKGADAGGDIGRKRKAGEMETENDEVQIIDLT